MKERLEAIFKRMFNVEEIDDDTSPENTEGWDSFTHIELVLEIETEFGVSISTAEAVELTSVGTIMSFLRQHGAAD